MKENEIIFKNNRIKNEEHYIAHLKYIEKDDAMVFQKPNDEMSLEVINLHRSRLRASAGKRGRPPVIARDLIFSMPHELNKADIDKKSYSALIQTYLSTVFTDIQKKYPDADLNWLMKNCKIVLHEDSDHTHYHVNLPTFTKEIGSDKLITIDFSHRDISANARRKMYSFCNQIIGNSVPDLTLDEFKDKSKKAAMKNKKAGDSWKKKKAKLNKADVKYVELMKSVEEVRGEIKRYDGATALLTKEVNKLIDRAFAQLNNGNSDRAMNSLSDAQKKIEKSKSLPK